MNALKFFVFALACLPNPLSASPLSSACQSCPKELHIHLVGGTLSIFGKKIGSIKAVPEEQIIGMDILKQASVAFDAIPDAGSETAINFTKVRSTKESMNYELDGKLNLPDGTQLNVVSHSYYYLSDSEALYKFGLVAPDGRQLTLLGEVERPQSESPMFWGVILNGTNQALYLLKIPGRNTIEAERALQHLERFSLDRSVLPSAQTPAKKSPQRGIAKQPDKKSKTDASKKDTP